MSQFTPPSDPARLDDSLFEEPPKWPQVVGIISIVWGSLGFVCGGLGGLLSPFMSGFMSQAAQGHPLPPTMQFGPIDYILTGAKALVGLLLLTAGILTVSRKPAGRPVHLLYGLLAIPFVFAAAAQAYSKHGRMAQYVVDNPDSPFTLQHNNAVSLAGIAFYLLIALVWPVFCLIWFGMVKRRPEDMTGSAPPPAA